MVYGRIYKIPFPNGKNYIGLTTQTLKKRRRKHKDYAISANETRVLYKALRKYNMIDTFQLVEIDTAETLEELCEKEIEYIKKYNSYYKNNRGYNMTFGGEGINGYVFTEECRQKMSESTKKYHEEHPEAGKQHSDKLKRHYEEHPEAGRLYGERMKKHFEEHPETRQKMSEAKKKHYEEHPEARQEMSEKTKKYYQEHPEARKINSVYKPFDVFEKDGTYVKSFDYQFEAKEYLQKIYGIKGRNILISNVLQGKRKFSLGFIFKYKE
jgi:hypothetical protein